MREAETDGTPTPAFIVVGEMNVDLILEKVNALPQLGKERIAQGMTLTLGSSSAILASNASAIGADVGFIGRTGSDPFGRFVVDRLRARGVDTRHVIETAEVPTGLTAVYTKADDRGAVTFPGAMETLSIQDIPWSYLTSGRHLHLSSYYLQTGLRPDCAALFRRAKESGLSTSIDTNWDPEEVWADDIFDVLEYVDVFLPNEAEARLITGMEDLGDAMEELARYAGTVVVTCGADGARARRGAALYDLPSVKVDPIDAVGAGDSFNAGFLNQYLRGKPLEHCLKFGVVTGAFSTLSAGGTAAFEDIPHFNSFVETTMRSFPPDDELLSSATTTLT